MPIDQTMRGLALEIDASLDPASEAQPVLEYRFIDLASTQTILARIKGIPQPNGGGELAFETNTGALPRPSGCLLTAMATSALEREIRQPDWMSSVTRSLVGRYQFKALSEWRVSRKSMVI